MSTYIPPRFVDHPQLGDRLLDLNARWREGFEAGLVRDQHILEHPASPYSHQPKLDELLRLSAGTERLQAHPLGEADHLLLLGAFYELSEPHPTLH